MNKSITQMTKAELRQVILEKDRVIAELNCRIDDLESMAIASQAVPMNADSSRLLSNMNAKIRSLEQQLKSQIDAGLNS